MWTRPPSGLSPRTIVTLVKKREKKEKNRLLKEGMEQIIRKKNL
jgi:hypothetical protein